MKAIMISVKPKWVAKILNGEKTIEIRKTMPKCDLPIDAYIYCTKDREMAKMCKYPYNKETKAFLNLGKVVAKFTLNKVEEISWQIGVYELEKQWFIDFLDKCCLGFCELKNYLNKKNGYAWHIDNLVIFDKPKELSEFYKVGANAYQKDIEQDYGERAKRYTNCFFQLTKAPQSWCYVEVE